MAVSALPFALLRGAQLTFDGAGMAIPYTVSLTAAASVGTTSLSIADTTGTTTTTDVPSGAQARDSGVNAATGARLLIGCRKGTSVVKLWCNSRYDDTQLVLAGSVCDWATVAAAKFLCTRRAQGCPKGIKAEYDEALQAMRMVQGGQLQIEDIGTRDSDWPTVTNITVNPGYDGMRARVEPNITEQSPTNYSQYIDWNSAMRLDF